MRFLSVSEFYCLLLLSYVESASLLGTIESIFFPKPLFTGLQYGSYYKGPVCQPSTAIRNPETIAEVVGIVHEAIGSGKTVKALGAQHSATDIICTSGIPINMKKIDSLEMNSDNTIVTVGAGATVYKLTKYLRTVGRGLIATPAYANITIGGAIGTGAHGSTLRYTPASLSEQVVGIELIDGSGVLRIVTDVENLKALKVHLGLLGIITRVMLMTVPLYKVRSHNYVVSDDIMFNGKMANIVHSGDGFAAFWFPQFHQVVFSNFTMVPTTTPGEAYSYDIPSTTAAFNLINSPLLESIQATDSYASLNVFQTYEMSTLYQTTPGYVPIHTEDGTTVVNPAVGYYDDLYASTCNEMGDLQCAWLHGPNNITLTDNEMSIPLVQLPNVAKRVKRILSKYPATFAAKGIILRFTKATDTYMSLSEGRDSCHFEFFTYSRKDVYRTASSGLAAYQAILQSLAHEFNGRSHWGKSGLHYHSTDLINLKLDPIAKQNFIMKMNEFDPNGIFMNDFGRRLRGSDTKINFDPETIHCALLDNCICGSNRDCAPGQTCGTLDGLPNYPVCLTPGHALLQVINVNPILSQILS